MEPQTPQFNQGVRVIPKGSQPLTPSLPQTAPKYGYGDVISKPLPVNASTNPSGTISQKYGQGEIMDKGYTKGIPVKVDRPKPNQGVTVPGTGGKPPVTIGGEKGIKVHTPKVRGGGLRGAGGVGGIFGKMIR